MCFFCSAVGRQNHRTSCGQRCCFGRKFCNLLGVSQVGETEDLLKMPWCNALLRDFTHITGYPLHVRVWNVPDFSEFAESPDESCQDHLWNISSSTFLCFLRRCHSWDDFQLEILARALFPASISSPCWWVSILEQSFCDMRWILPGWDMLRSKELARHAEFPSNFGMSKSNLLLLCQNMFWPKSTFIQHTFYKQAGLVRPLSGVFHVTWTHRTPQDPHPVGPTGTFGAFHVFRAYRWSYAAWLCSNSWSTAEWNSQKSSHVAACGDATAACRNPFAAIVGLTWCSMVWSSMKSLISDFWLQQWWSSLASSWPMSLASSISFSKAFTWMPAWLLLT